MFLPKERGAPREKRVSIDENTNVKDGEHVGDFIGERLRAVKKRNIPQSWCRGRKWLRKKRG